MPLAQLMVAATQFEAAADGMRQTIVDTPGDRDCDCWDIDGECWDLDGDGECDDCNCDDCDCGDEECHDHWQDYDNETLLAIVEDGAAEIDAVSCGIRCQIN